MDFLDENHMPPGLITASEAVELGLDRRDVRRRVERGEWVRLRRGIYAPSWVATDEPDSFEIGQRRQDDAISRALGIAHVRSHASAALIFGLAILRTSRTHVTTHVSGASRRTPELTVHAAGYADSDVVQVGDVACLSMARTVLDIARERPLRHGVVAIDSALRTGTTPIELEAAASTMRRWPGIRAARRALALSDAGSESVGETLARLLVLRLGVGAVETQFGLTDGTRTAYADLRIGRHLIEFDGKTKYRSDAGEVVWGEKVREDWLRGFSLGMSRLVWADCWGGETRTMARLAREYADTCRRFGTSIEDLTPYRIARRPAA